MRRYKYLLLFLALWIHTLGALAEDVVVTVTPTLQVYPPQIELYLNKPGDLFNITLSNTSNETQQVYLSLQIEHMNPADGLSVATPNNYQPAAPFEIPANGSYSLTTVDMMGLFNHIPSQAMLIPDGLMDGYMNGSFGLLPEGLYEVHFEAYKWRNPQYSSPVPCSNPIGGRSSFTVCYKAQAPTFINPLVNTVGEGLDTAKVNIHNPLFTWTQPVVTCSPSAYNYTYDLRIVELLDGQQPDVAMDRNPTVYIKSGLTGPLLTIDEVTVKTKFSKDKVYAAQVTASQVGGSALNYVMLENKGKSPYRLFKLVEGDDDFFDLSMAGMEGSSDDDTLYNFRNPDITSPRFEPGEIRRCYKESDIYVTWDPAWFISGVGEDPYDLKMDYTVELYNGRNEADLEKTLAKQPVYKETTAETNYVIPWDAIKEKVALKDYLVLRVVPHCKDNEDVIFTNDSLNIRDFTLSEHVLPKYFQCRTSVIISNYNITTKKASDFIGKEVGLGEYQLTIDKIETGNAEKGFTGRGRVKWELPMGTAMIHVKFDTLRINTDDVVIGGLASSCPNESVMTNYQAIENIFSDLGLENLLADADVPYANVITSGAKKNISEKIDGLANYYSIVKGLKGIDKLLKGKSTDVYLPICLPKDKYSELNSSPVDIQITTMKFAPTWATMDLLGEFTMPNSKCLASDLLVFGAPRLCVSPNELIPESGTLALLDKFVVTDPNTRYECTFKAPADLLSPTDGCYLAWHDHKFEKMGVDVDMKIPDLKKYDTKADKVTNEVPILNMKGDIVSWDNFILHNISMDPFEAESLPGFTFTCSNISFDHSVEQNADAMASYKFPDKYNKQEGVGQDNYKLYGLNGWEGLYIGEVSIALPKGISGPDGRLKVTGKDLLFDRSGVTMDADLEQLISAKLGGFAFDINRVGLTFIQSNFDNCHIEGSLTVPLLKNEKKEPSVIGLTCQIRKQLDDKGKEGKEFAYIFNTKSLTGDYMLDVFLAKLRLDEKLTYLLVEAEPKSGTSDASKLTTRCELLLGGSMEIGGKETIENWANNKIGYKLSLPDIHFVGMRLANCKSWKSKYVTIQADIDKAREQQKKDAKGDMFIAGKEINNGTNSDGSNATFFFHTGSWSLASEKKQLGPFEFSIEDYDIKKKLSGTNLTLGLAVTGKVALVKGIDISADASFDINGKMKNLGTDLSKIEGSFDGVDLKKIGVDATFCGIGLKGAVEFVSSGDNPDVGKGFAASLDITMPGNLFTVHGDGGYFDYDSGAEQYSWGWVHVKLSGNIVLGPCSITSLGGGFYMNCSRNPSGDELKPKNVAGLVGIFLELGMATPDGTTLKGDMTLNVVYNRKRKCLSNFTMTGNVKAVGGIINSNMTLVYENTDTDRYLQLNITVDASLSSESMAGSLGSFGSNLGTIKDQMKLLAGDKYKEPLTDSKQGLSSKIGAKATDEDADKDPSEVVEENAAAVASKHKTSKQGGMPKMGATISLDVKFTWRKGGTNYSKPKWHVYLGEPAEDKRCTLTLISFESGIVDCHVGANAYICVGNELPNNGELPPLPDKIAKFLDGSKHGDFQSDNVSQAQAARQQALQGFNGEITGGVMLGAMGYGDIRINLGLIEGKLEAILGFDVSVVHYKNGYCVNLGKIPGYKGWYGKGQLYAYLYMLLALHFNLGFIDYDFNLAEAEIGGVLKMGGPSPNYFQGKARAKISLLSGLFKFDKSFEFECGQYCQLFKGNPLDDFILFDDCSLGDTIRGKGWTEDKAGTVSISADMQPKVKVNIRTPQYANTKAPLTEHFRLLDENELERIAGQFGEGSQEWEDSKMQAKRTFIFRDFGEMWLFEYDSPSQYKNHSAVAENASFATKKNNAMEYCGATNRYVIPLEKGGSKSRRYMDLGTLRSKLKPGKFYRLVAAGYAKEILKGVETDPLTYYNSGKNKGNIPWVKVAEYYFQTEKENIVNDKAPLQDYVAIAYPSHYNMLRSPESDVDSKTGAVKHMDAYLGDVQAPTIALTEDIRTKAFKKGKLYWRLLSPMGKQLDIVENVWVEGDPLGNGSIKTINMEPQRKLNAKANQRYILQLDYYTREYLADDEFDPNSKKWQTMDTTLVRLYVSTLDSRYNWIAGCQNGMNSCIYDQPFIAQKITTVNIKRPYSGSVTDATIMKNNYFTKCPMTFIGYMSNFVFPAGWEITERKTFGIEVTTSESLLFHDPGKGGKFEGVYNENDTYRTYNSFNDIRNTFVYVIPNTKTNGQYNVTVQYPLSSYWHENGYGDWDYVHDVDERIQPYFPTLNTSNYNRCVEPVFRNITSVYKRVYFGSLWMNAKAESMETIARKDRYINALSGEDVSDKYYRGDMKTVLKNWYENHRGTYVTENGTFVHAADGTHAFFVPTYQFPVVWSITSNEKISGAYKGMSNNNDRAQNAGPTWSKMTGMTWYDTKKENPAETQQEFDFNGAIDLFDYANIEAYRVNSYDTNAGHYYVVNNLLNGQGSFTMRSNSPLNDQKKNTGIVAELKGNTSGTSVGKATGVSSVNGVDTSTSTTSLTSAQLDKYLRSILEMHDSCQVLYNAQQVYWPRYQKWADKLTGPSIKAEKAAKNSVAAYSCATSDRLEKSNNYATKTVEYIKEARVWRDSVSIACYRVNPTTTWNATSPVTKKYGRFRSIKDITANINKIMDRYITPQSDPNSTQYQRYRAMQDEAKGWNSQLQAWRDSIYNSLYGSWDGPDGKEYGYSKTYVNKYEWAENHLKARTPRNFDKAQETSKEITSHAAKAKTTQRNAQTAIEEALDAINDARHKLGKGATYFVPSVETEDIVDYVVGTNPNFFERLPHVSDKDLKLEIIQEVLKDHYLVGIDKLEGVAKVDLTDKMLVGDVSTMDPKKDIGNVVKGIDKQSMNVDGLINKALTNLEGNKGVSLYSNMPNLSTQGVTGNLAINNVSMQTVSHTPSLMSNTGTVRNAQKASTTRKATKQRQSSLKVVSSSKKSDTGPVMVANQVAQSAGMAKKASTGQSYAKIRGSLEELFTNVINTSQKNIEELQTYIQNRKDALADFEIVKQKQKQLQEYGASLDASLYYIGGSDGEGGEIATFLEVFNELSCPYKNACTYYDRISKIREEVTNDSIIILNQLERLPTAEEIEEEIEEAQLKLDEAMGRDRNAAERELQRLDSLLSAVQVTISKYESGTVRTESNKKLRTLFNEIKQCREFYQNGDLSMIQDCLDYCEEFEDEYQDYKAGYDEVETLYNGISSMANTIWEGLAKAGYPEDHELVKAAKQKWTEENQARQVNDIYAQYLMIHGSLSNLANNVAIIRKEAEGYQQDSSVLMDKVGPYALKNLVAMQDVIQANGADIQQFASAIAEADELKQQYTAIFNSRKWRAETKWNDYVSHLIDGTTNPTLIKVLQECLTTCTSAKETAEDFIGSYNEKLNRIFSNAQDSIRRADNYLNMIPKDNPSQDNEASLYFGEIIHKRIVDFYSKDTKAQEDVQTYYSETLPSRYDAEVDVFRKQAQGAIDYIESHGEPERLPVYLLPFYDKEIDQMSAKVAACKDDFGPEYTKLKRQCSSLSTAYNTFVSSVETLKNLPSGLHPSDLNKLYEQAAQYGSDILKMVDQVIGSGSRLNSYCETALSSFETAQNANTYIQQNATSREYSDLRNSSQKRISDMQETLQSIIKVQPTIKTYVDEARRIGRDTELKLNSVSSSRSTTSSVSSSSVRRNSSRK